MPFPDHWPSPADWDGKSYTTCVPLPESLSSVPLRTLVQSALWQKWVPNEPVATAALSADEAWAVRWANLPIHCTMPWGPGGREEGISWLFS